MCYILKRFFGNLLLWDETQTTRTHITYQQSFALHARGALQLLVLGALRGERLFAL
jgi:hypothetical protein